MVFQWILSEERDLISKSLEMPISGVSHSSQKVRPVGHNGVFQRKRGRASICSVATLKIFFIEAK